MRRSTLICSELYCDFTGMGVVLAAVRPYCCTKRPPGLVGAERVPGVEVDALQDVRAAIADVGHFGREPAAQGSLIGDVPRVQLPLVPIDRHHAQRFSAQGCRVQDAVVGNRDNAPAPACRSPARRPAAKPFGAVNCCVCLIG